MTIGDDETPDPDRHRFRTFTGEGAWDEQSMQRIQAELRARRARDGDGDVRGGDEALVSAAVTEPARHDDSEPAHDDDSEPAPIPASARAILLAATAIGVLALVSVGAWWIVDATDKHPSPTPVALPSAWHPPAATTPASIDVTSYSYSPPPDTTAPSPTDTCDPASVVNYYYSAINEGDYDSAWQLGGENLTTSCTDFVNGFADTASDQWTASDTSPTAASIELTATQLDGSVDQYAGTYTVENCVITSAQISAVG